MNVSEVVAFILYFCIVLGIGLFFFFKSKGGGASDYFLGGRSMGPYVTAMSAQASDMSGWLLMGLPGSILAFGFGKVWISIGLAIGTYLNWRFTAARLRRFSQAANDSITIPQYLRNRFATANPALQVVSAIVFLVCFTVYVASGFKAGASLFSSVLGLDAGISMIIFAIIIVVYTFTGGFKAVSWTDFFQGLMMLVAVITVPIVILMTKEINLDVVTASSPHYFNFLPSGKFDWESISSILSGLAWGFGYFGMPHILVRFMAIKNSRMIKRSRRVASVWVILTLAAAAVIGVLGRVVLPDLIGNGQQEQVFIQLVKMLFPGFVSGILLSAILAAAMSTADSQLLVASSSFTSDIYQPLIRKNQAKDKEVLWVGRLVVIAVSIVAYFVASNPNSGSIMDLVENAWAGFGAAFGPVIILSLYWKRFTYKGAIAGIVGGGLTVVLWIAFLSGPTGLYELIPGAIVGFAGCVIGSLVDKKPGKEVTEIFERAMDPNMIED